VLLSEVGPGERQVPRQHLVGHDTERVYIGGSGGTLELPLFGRGVRPSQVPFSGVGASGRLRVASNAEVGQAPPAVQSQHIARLEVAVNDGGIARGQVSQGRRNVREDVHGLAYRQRPAG
jgi:hypothetical protein